MEAYEEAVRLEPDATAHHNRALALSRLGRTEGAVRAFRAALERRPDFPEALAGLGTGLARLGRDEDAVEAYTEAIRIRPTFAEAHYNLAVSLAKLGRRTESLRSCQEAIRLRPDIIRARELLVSLEAAVERPRGADEIKARQEGLR